MSVELETLPAHRPSGIDEADHLFCCCSPAIGICGADLTGEPECVDCDHPECEKCAALADEPCILCGFTTTGPCYCGRC